MFLYEAHLKIKINVYYTHLYVKKRNINIREIGF